MKIWDIELTRPTASSIFTALVGSITVIALLIGFTYLMDVPISQYHKVVVPAIAAASITTLFGIRIEKRKWKAEIILIVLGFLIAAMMSIFWQ